MDKINPMLYITDHDPVPEEVMDASGWFEMEYITVEFRWSYTINATWGPAENSLAWYMAQGWVVYDKTVEDVGRPGDVYLYKYYLRRRKMQSERVLNDMIREFTEAYNEGREVNDRRYDEIVALYNVMLDKTENEIIGLSNVTDKYDDLIDRIINGLPGSADDYEKKVESLLRGYGDSMRDEINIRFDNEKAKARQELVGRGLFNSTIWTTTSAGIERLRARALAELEDKLVERKLGAADDVQRIKMELNDRFELAAHRLMDAQKNRRFGASEFRNAVLTSMLNFMERRSDEYPGLGELASIAAQLGYAEGGTVAPAGQ
ncbi:MAG: hypothetical protein ACOYD3_08530 [Kiritimatiellia bacterium]|jgi:hypothetical protein